MPSPFDLESLPEHPTHATGRPRRTGVTIPKRFLENRSEETDSERPFPKKRRLVPPDTFQAQHSSLNATPSPDAFPEPPSASCASASDGVHVPDIPPSIEHAAAHNQDNTGLESHHPSCQPTTPPLPNIFGLYRECVGSASPDRDPDYMDDNLSVEHSESPRHGLQVPHNPYYPYPNWTSFRLGKWYWEGSVTKSEASFRELVEILLDPGFDQTELRGTKWRDINRRLATEDVVRAREDADEWCENPIKLPVPLHKRTHSSGIYTLEATSLWHRKILSVIRSRLTGPEGFSHFHLEPYRLFWRSGGDPSPSRVYGEAYTSQTFIDAHEELQRSAREPGCDLPRVVVALMFASDQTHLTDFGHDKLWPLYMAFGNESKHRRSELSTRAFEHVAYFGAVSLPFLCALSSHLSYCL